MAQSSNLHSLELDRAMALALATFTLLIDSLVNIDEPLLKVILRGTREPIVSRFASANRKSFTRPALEALVKSGSQAFERLVSRAPLSAADAHADCTCTTR